MSQKTLESRRNFLRTGGVAAGSALLIASKPLIASGEDMAKAGDKHHRWGFLIDLDRCLGCKACAISCKTEADVPLGVFRSSVIELDEGKFPNVGRSFLPWLCNHCENTVCITGCPVEEVEAEFVWLDKTVKQYKKRATYQRPDGIVLVDQDRCVGCGACVELCPYNVRFLNPAKKITTPDAVGENPAEKCDLCVHRLDEGIVPACVNTCQSGARIVGDLNDPESEISKIIRSKGMKVLKPEEGTNPQCRYVSLNPKTYSEGRDTR